jgi:glucose-1-phosphate adenylyltransferase
VSAARVFLPQDTIVFGADNLDSAVGREAELAAGNIPLGIGANTQIKKAIIDSNARIGKWCNLTNKAGVMNGDNSSLPKGVVIKDGILVVMRGAVVPDHTTV